MGERGAEEAQERRQDEGESPLDDQGFKRFQWDVRGGGGEAGEVVQELGAQHQPQRVPVARANAHITCHHQVQAQNRSAPPFHQLLRSHFSSPHERASPVGDEKPYLSPAVWGSVLWRPWICVAPRA